jgi:hypothetical protein
LSGLLCSLSFLRVCISPNIVVVKQQDAIRRGWSRLEGAYTAGDAVPAGDHLDLIS